MLKGKAGGPEGLAAFYTVELQLIVPLKMLFINPVILRL